MNILAIPSLRWRLVVVMVLADLIVAITTGVVTYKSQQSSLHNQIMTRATGGAHMLAAGAAPIFVFHTNNYGVLLSNLQNLVATLKTTQGIGSAAVYRADGCQIASTLPTRRRVCKPLSSLRGTHTLSNGDVESFADIVPPVGLVGVAAVTASSTLADTDLRNSTIASAAVRALGVLIFLLLSLAIAQFLLAPLESLARAARSIGSGDLSARVPEEGNTELTSLAHSFNNMALNLEQRIKQLSFLATAGSTLPNTFRNSGDVRPIIAQFCDQVDACGAGLVPRGDGDPEPLWYQRDEVDVAFLTGALRLGHAARLTETSVEDGRSVMVVPVLGNTVFVAMRHEANPFTREEQQVIINFAYQLGIAADNARLFESQQEALQVKDQFLSIVSHELRTPLTTIKGYSQMLGRRLESDSTDGRYAANIDAQVTRLTRLVDDLLDVTRFTRGQFELELAPTDIRPMLEDMVMRFRMVAPRHSFQLELGSEPLTGTWDRDRLEQVVNNLLSNAVKYSPNGGDIIVRGERKDGDVVVSVRDHGLGIDEESRKHLFERFYRARGETSEIKGLGLGLYVTRRIVEAHHGEIEVESTPGEGSEFTVTLPALRQPAHVER